jgi:hypothetical protein
MTDVPTELRDRIEGILRRFHQNACYPTPMDGQVEDAVHDIVTAIIEATYEPAA